MKINIFWFRRDLRLDDNTALDNALHSELPVLPVFIFDENIIEELPADDSRISFIYYTLSSINKELNKSGSAILIKKGNPEKVWKELIASYNINSVYYNKDYEPYAIQRDNVIEKLLVSNGITVKKYKDQVIFEEREILKSDNSPYTVFTPYKNRWLEKLRTLPPSGLQKNIHPDKKYFSHKSNFPKLHELGFTDSQFKVRPVDKSAIINYDALRDFPAEDGTTYLGPHLRFGTVSIRKIVSDGVSGNSVFLSELIWREFFMQILFNFPNVVTGNFKAKYDNIQWRNNEAEFGKWCQGVTGYPFVDAGMRQLNETGFMHNRVRMITAGFLCKHLLIDWRWGEAYFAQKLLDYELSSNNGNWQWASGTGCDAVPYFRIFNPELQLEKFDSKREYIRKWIPEIKGKDLIRPMVDHDFARLRAIAVYKAGIKQLSRSVK
jgi:deoxyribodipyrimidine photo-lyase